jgi:hypothetical protein
MYNSATGIQNMTAGDDDTTLLQGAINFIARVFPLLAEDKAFASRCMWKE